ncbi:tetratricopeptide repeat protein [Nakamurella sp.]|uniref:tetratricopeptide repeat protein n=1 Tax=Nakamurella sp. TaxID=1869182 RepID=UPI003784954D
MSGQIAIGNYIAQADNGATANLSVFQVAMPAPPDADTVDQAIRLLEHLPVDPPAEPGALPNHSRMPLAPNPLFTGRYDELHWLSAHLGTSAVQAPTVVLNGLAGVGKSQIASEYAHLYGRFYAGGVYWVSLANSAKVDSEIAACGGPAGMSLRPDFSTLAMEDQVSLVRAAWQSPLPRLVIFDNCEDESLLARWRPPSGGCRIIVTSRRSAWSPALRVTVRPVDVLDRADGCRLLAAYREPVSAEDEEALSAIADELGNLPLALHLAGSYLSRYHRVLTPAVYLRQLSDSPLIDHRSLTAAGISPTDHIQSIATTFAISVDGLASEPADDLATTCLVLGSYLAPGEPIPRSLLKALLDISSDADDDLDLEDALSRLADLGLAQLIVDGTPRLHRLVAAFVEFRLGSDEARDHVESTLWDFLSTRTFTLSSLSRAEYEPHLRVVAERAIPRGDLPAAGLANTLGLYASRRGDRETAIRYVEQALSMRENVFGVDSPETAKDLNDLGFAYLGGPTRTLGEPYLERARRLWDPLKDGPNLAATLDNLGQLYLASGRIEPAEDCFEQALAIREQELGEDSYPTSVTVQNLGAVARARGDNRKAAELFERSARIRDALGDRGDPNSTARAHQLSAMVRDELGDVPAAAAHWRRAAELSRQALGPMHPNALFASVQAALYATENGDPSGASELLKASQALRDGLDQAQALAHMSGIDLNNLGFACWLSGDYTQARTLYELALGKDGSEPTTLNNLGMIEERLGRYERAISYYRRAMEGLANTVVANSRSTALGARILNNLGVSQTLNGDSRSGRESLNLALEIRGRLQGTNGADYAVTLRNLALAAQAESRLEDAMRLAEQSRNILATYSTVGSEYSRTLLLLGDLLAEQGRATEALATLELAAAARSTTSQPDHPDLAVIRWRMASVLQSLGHDEEACRTRREALRVIGKCMGPDHPWTTRLRDEVAACASAAAGGDPEVAASSVSPR